MRKLFIAAALLLSVAAISTVRNDRTKQFSDMAYVSVPSHNDTVPADTTKKDSASFGLLSYNVMDTVPSDTTKKDTTSSLAYNIVRDTVPTDTSKKDTSSFQYLAFVK